MGPTTRIIHENHSHDGDSPEDVQRDEPFRLFVHLSDSCLFRGPESNPHRINTSRFESLNSPARRVYTY